MLTSFYISNFRCFKELEVPRLGRVNLIVGKNNTGKTTLLEAIRLYEQVTHAASRGFLSESVGVLLATHDEFASELGSEEILPRTASLFHGQARNGRESKRFRIGPDKNNNTGIEVSLVQNLEWQSNDPGDGNPGAPFSRETAPTLHVRWQDSSWPFQLRTAAHAIRRRLPDLRPPLVVRGEQTAIDSSIWWDNILLDGADDAVLECLKIIAPIKRVSLVANPARPPERMFVVHHDDFVAPIPLKSLGDGVGRIFQIALAIQHSTRLHSNLFPRDGLDFDAEPPSEGSRALLFDEIENGIHYSVLEKLWRFVFKAAQAHDLQIFATSHSWDCVEAFQLAAKDELSCDAVLVRIERKGEKTRAVIFDEHDLDVITRNEIEVR